MANTHVFETKMSDRMQVTRFSVPVWAGQASFEERAKLKSGQSVTRPYTSFSREDMGYYTRGTDLTPISVTETNETLTINTIPAAALPIDDFDELQSNFALQAKYAKDMRRAIDSILDMDYLAEVENAVSTVDAGDVGGSAGSPIDLTVSNVKNVYAVALRKLREQDVNIAGIGDQRIDRQNIKAGNQKPGGSAGFANISPYFSSILELSKEAKATELGDMIGKNGYVNTFFSFDNFVTTNSLWYGVLGMATNPTDGDTIVYNGVTITFVATLSGGTSEIHIASTVDITRANLAEWLNAGGASAEAEGTDTGYSAASASEQKALKWLTATNDNTANTLTISAKGRDYVVVSETFTDGTDAWTKQEQHLMFGQKGAVDMVVQKAIGVKVSEIPLQFGMYLKPHALYGKKTFLEGTKALVCVKINTASI